MSKNLLLIASLIAGTFALTACDKAQEATEKAGDAAVEATEKAGDAAVEATEKAGDAAKEAVAGEKAEGEEAKTRRS